MPVYEAPAAPARPPLLNDGVKRREVWAWAMYDFANSGYTTVVLTAVFNAYFVGVVAGNADWATFAWTAALGFSNALVMVLMPALGAYADLRAAKKRLLVLATIGCAVSDARQGSGSHGGARAAVHHRFGRPAPGLRAGGHRIGLLLRWHRITSQG